MQRYILQVDGFGRERILASPLSGLRLPVVSAYTRAKDGVTTVRYHTRSLSQIRQQNHPAPAGFFLRFPPCFPAHLHTSPHREQDCQRPKTTKTIEFYRIYPKPVPIQ